MADPHGAIEIDVDNAFEDVCVKLLAPPDYAGAVDHHIKLREGTNKPAHLFGATHIEQVMVDPSGTLPPACLINFALGCARRDDPGTSVAKGFSQPATNASGAARDQRSASCKPAASPISG
jgi:hypothetical protein